MRALVVEDNPLVVMDLAEALGELGWEAVAAASARECREALAGPGGWDAVLLDLDLGEGVDFSLARALKERGLPLAFASGWPDMPDDLKSVPVLSKPAATADLARLLRRLAGGGDES